MKKLILAVILMTITLSTFAQETILRKSSKGVLESVEFSANDTSVTVPAYAEIFFKEILKTKSKDEFRKIQRKQKQKDFVREHFEQYYNGIKIEGAGYNFHYKNGKMFFAHGHYVNTNNVDTKPFITKLEAMENFARYKNIPTKDVSNYIAELIIKEIPEKTDTLPALVYKVYLYADYPQNTEIGFIDAHTGNLRMTESAFIDFSATGTFVTRYSGTKQGITHNYQGGYHLVDSIRSAILHTWNLEGRTNISSRVDLIDNDNNWTQTEHNSNNNDMGLDVQWTLQSIYDRLSNAHGVNSMDDDLDNDGNGFTVNAHIRDGTDPNNAFWSPVERTLSFGEGGSIFRSLASVDVVAHEFGHGITQFQIDWNNTTDQRAFNEGLSDIWGAIMEQRIHPNSVWQIGEQLTIGYACLRNIQNTNASDARDKIANTFNSAQYNSGNSYVRGGVFSHWFYLLVNGGTGTNDLGRSYFVRGVGIDLAENLIVKAVYDGYLRFSTSYAQIRTSMINAAREIAGTNSYLEHQVENAWYAVGVGSIQYQYIISGPSQICNQGTYTINLPTGASVTWSSSPIGFLQLVSGQGTDTAVFSKVLNKNNNIISALISLNGQSFTIYKYGIQSGTPQSTFEIYDAATDFQVSRVFVNKNYYFYGVENAIEDDDYTWRITSPTPYPVTTAIDGRQAYYTASTVGHHLVTLQYNGICGWSDIYSEYVYFEPSKKTFLSISPNPASELVNVTVTENLASDNSMLSLNNSNQNTLETDYQGAYEIQLWNENSGLVKTLKSEQSKLQISLKGLPKGMYYVHMIIEGKTTQKKILWIK